MATNRIDVISERRAKRHASTPSPQPAPVQKDMQTPDAGNTLPSPKYGDMPNNPPTPSQVAGSQVDNAKEITYGNSGIVPTVTSDMNYRQDALRTMTEGEFERDKGQMNASDQEYWAIQAKEKPLSTYANVQRYLASGETPAEQAKRERREHLGQVFANLGNLIGNAANLYYTSQGAYPADLNAGAIAENERMRRIKDKRDALKARQDALLAQAKGDDIRNAYSLQLARDKARAQQAAKDREREDDMAKFKLKLDADAKKAGDTLAETRRHNRAMEARAAQQDSKVLDSGIASDGNVYTRNTKLSENETIQFVKKYMSDDDLKQYIRTEIEPVYNPATNQFENSGKMYVDWDAALGQVLQSGVVPPEELSSRGFKKSGRTGERPLMLQELGYDPRDMGGLAIDTSRNSGGKARTVEGFGNGSSNDNGKKKIEGF